MDVLTGHLRYRLRKVVPVCSKNDPICPNTLYLSTTSPMTVGRKLSEEVQVRFLSKTTPLLISRKHATIYLSENGKVDVEDHSSLNGVYVWNKRILPGSRQQLQVGDKIAFGCGVGSSDVSEFEYYLEAVPETQASVRRIEPPNIESDYFSLPPAKCGRTPCASSTLATPSLATIESNAAHIKEQEIKIRQLSEDLVVKERAQHELRNRLQETEKGLLEKFEEQRRELENERDEAENHLKVLLEQQLREKEETLKNEYDEQIRILQTEKDIVETNLQNELSCKLSEKDEVYQKALEQQKLALEVAMEDKENEKNTLVVQLQVKEGLIEKYKSVEENQKQLESCLDELRKEIEEKDNELDKQKVYTKKVETDAKQTVIQTMEDEFTCSICQELFLDATTLPCAHTFCEHCLRLWLKKKKTCPVCRCKLKEKGFRSVVLDSAIEKIIESMDENAKQRRVELKREREEQKRRENTAEYPQIRHRVEDDHGMEERENNNQQGRNNHVVSNDNRNRRGNNRSRSRSPRNSHVRHQPYHNYRVNNNGGNNNSPSVYSAGFQQDQGRNAAQLPHQLTNNNNQRFNMDRMDSNQPYIPNNIPNTSGANQQHAPNYNRRGGNRQHAPNHNRRGVNQQNAPNYGRLCFVCGSADHLVRSCPVFGQF